MSPGTEPFAPAVNIAPSIPFPVNPIDHHPSGGGDTADVFHSHTMSERARKLCCGGGSVSGGQWQ